MPLVCQVDDPCCNPAQALAFIELWFWQTGSERYIRTQLSLVHRFEHSTGKHWFTEVSHFKDGVRSNSFSSPRILHPEAVCSQVVFPLRIKAIRLVFINGVRDRISTTVVNRRSRREQGVSTP